MARRVSRNPAAYDYLAESIVNWPAQAELARMLRTAGWSAVEWHNLTLGIVAVHVARRPKPDPAPAPDPPEIQPPRWDARHPAARDGGEPECAGRGPAVRVQVAHLKK